MQRWQNPLREVWGCPSVCSSICGGGGNMRAQDGASLTAVQWAQLRRHMPPHRTKLRMLSATCVPQVAPCWTLHRHHAFGKVRHVIVGITLLFCQKSYRQGVPGVACGGRRPISLANFQPAREVRLPLLSGTFSISGQKNFWTATFFACFIWTCPAYIFGQAKAQTGLGYAREPLASWMDG